MIAKCGNLRVHHWAHRAERTCDPWWERETEWHRAWKGKFPAPWQEVIRLGPLGEKHIADVHTPRGLTVEFQHSHLGQAERAAREKFYGNMLWVVDGSRLKHDLRRFLGHAGSFRALKKGWYVTSCPEDAFPPSWLHCTVPVLFDFENAIGPSPEAVHLTRALWCLLPGRPFRQAVVLQLSRESVVRSIHDSAHPIPARAIVENVAHHLLAEHRRQVQAHLHAAAIAARPRQSWRPRGFRRRLRRF